MLETRNFCSVCSNERVSNVGPDLNSNYLILIVYILTNSADPDEMPPNVAFHLGDSLQKMSVLYAAMKGFVDLSSADIQCKQFGRNQA